MTFTLLVWSSSIKWESYGAKSRTTNRTARRRRKDFNISQLVMPAVFSSDLLKHQMESAPQPQASQQIKFLESPYTPGGSICDLFPFNPSASARISSVHNWSKILRNPRITYTFLNFFNLMYLQAAFFFHDIFKSYPKYWHELKSNTLELDVNTEADGPSIHIPVVTPSCVEGGAWRPCCKKRTDVPFERSCAGNIKCSCLHRASWLL